MLFTSQSFGQTNFAKAELGDQRRTKRLVKLVDQMTTRPGGSLPQKLRHPADLQSFYRLMACDQVTHESILAPHRAAAIEQFQQIDQPVLILHDTTELDYTRRESLDDLGQKNTKPYFASVVAQGGTFAKVEKKKSVRELQPRGDEGGVAHMGHTQAGGQHLATVSEAYVPVMEGGRFLGAIEVYVDASALADTVEAEFRQAQYGLIGLLAMLGLASAFVIRSNIRDRNREVSTLTRAHESMA